MKRLAAWVLACVWLLSAPAWSDEPVSVMAASCLGCHEPPGAERTAIPTLSQRAATELATALQAYRSGDLTGTVMNRIARGYSESELAGLAQFFGEVVP